MTRTALQEPVDVYDKILHLIASEAVRMQQSGDHPDIGLGGLSGAVMSTVIFSWADGYEDGAEHVIDSVAKSAKETIREKRESETATS